MPGLKDHLEKNRRRIVKLVNAAIADTRRFSTMVRPNEMALTLETMRAVRDLGLAGQVAFYHDYRLPGLRTVAGIRGGQVSLRFVFDAGMRTDAVPVFAERHLIVEDYTPPPQSIETAADFAGYYLRKARASDAAALSAAGPVAEGRDAAMLSRIHRALHLGIVGMPLMTKMAGTDEQTLRSQFAAAGLPPLGANGSPA